MFKPDVFTYFLIVTVLVSTAAEKFTESDVCVLKNFEQVSTIVEKCKDILVDDLIIPGGKTLQMKLTNATVTFRGNVSSEYFEWAGPVVKITGSNVIIRGIEGSVFDGLGAQYWNGLGTWGNKTIPKFLKFNITNNGLLENINVLNCPVSCTSISGKNVIVRNWRVNNLAGDEEVAPENAFGHNTDGFKISRAENVLLENIVVYNQDDAVVVNSGKNITIRRMFCHGSHGLSISNKADIIEDVTYEDSIIVNTENGIHIKTHVDKGNGLIKNVIFRNITILDCKFYGISVEQNYRDQPAGIPQTGPPRNNIPIRNLILENIFGNVIRGGIPVYVLCAEGGCFDWKWNDVTIYGDTNTNNCTNYSPPGYVC